MAIDTPNGSRQPGSSAKATVSDSKPRGANRSSKTGGKLQVLPDQPEPPSAVAAATVLNRDLERVKAAIPVPETSNEPLSTSTAGSEDEDDAEDEDDQLEEQDAQVCLWRNGGAFCS